jgi:hypothetical protein
MFEDPDEGKDETFPINHKRVVDNVSFETDTE